MTENIVSNPASLAQLVSILTFVNTVLRLLLSDIRLMDRKILFEHFRL